MRPIAAFDADWHVHSTFSDGADTLAANIAAAETLRLTHLGCVDHVRRDTTYVPDYVAAVTVARTRTTVRLSIGIEAKILDAAGTLDVPDSIAGVDYVYVADHQFPGDAGPISPRVVRLALEGGERDAAWCIAHIVESTVAAMRNHRHVPLVLAHLFSIIPKLGLSEVAIDDAAMGSIAAAAAETGTIIEISERWRCPGPRMLEQCRAHCVRVVPSTDSHRASDIARYAYVREALKAPSERASLGLSVD